MLPVRQQSNAMLVGLGGNRHSSNSLAGMERIRLELLSILAFFTNYSFLQRNNNKHWALYSGAVEIRGREEAFPPAPGSLLSVEYRLPDFPSVFQIKIEHKILHWFINFIWCCLPLSRSSNTSISFSLLARVRLEWSEYITNIYHIIIFIYLFFNFWSNHMPLYRRG